MSKCCVVAGNLIVSALLLGGLDGCYQRVVRADGATAKNYKIYQPNLKDEDVKSSAKPKAADRLEKKVPSKTIETKVAP